MLVSHGYTLAGKATVSAFVDDLAHEVNVYSRLASLQGRYVLVCLGFIDLIRPYYYNVGIPLVGMMILSWAGECFHGDTFMIPDEREESWCERAMMCVDRIQCAGVLHQDIRAPNMLWNEERQRIMMVDFERSTLLNGVRQPLAQTSPNNLKRKRPTEEESDIVTNKNTSPPSTHSTSAYERYLERASAVNCSRYLEKRRDDIGRP